MTTFDDDHQELRDINDLPDELLLYIFQYLPLESFLLCENVCERWSKLVRDPAAWRSIEVIYDEYKNQHEKKITLNVINSRAEQILCLKIKYVYNNYSIITYMIELCKNLISLEIYFCSICKEFEDDIIKLPKLRKLNVVQTVTGAEVPDIVVQFNKLKDLNYLALSYWSVNSKNCYTILQCTHLSHIFIDKMEEWDLDFTKMLILSRQWILKALHIYGGSSVDDSILQLLSQCPQLEYLGFVNCRTLSDRGLLSLTLLKRIKHLQLKNNDNFSESALQWLFAGTYLPILDGLILNCIRNITATFVHLISERRPHLKYLYLNKTCYINKNYEYQFKSKYMLDMIL